MTDTPHTESETFEAAVSDDPRTEDMRERIEDETANSQKSETDTDEPLDNETLDQGAGKLYTINRARRMLDIHKFTLQNAIDDGLLQAVEGTDGKLRIPESEIDRALDDPVLYERIADAQRIKVRDLADAFQMKVSEVRKTLSQDGFGRGNPYWSEVRGRYGLPDNLPEFRQLVLDNREVYRDRKRTSRESRKERRRRRREEEQQRRNQLRAQLVAAFPAWADNDRTDQHMTLHIGPPNSGKTHDALDRLAEAANGWYLAPLRLLAWEIFDRLNERGVPCNLLTGEESIEVAGAQITAATVEMFNAERSGDVVIIDEAQMLADADRGWAWTRALMQAEAHELHVIAPPIAFDLIQNMAQAANIRMDTVFHDRLTPIRVAEHPWSLRTLPPRTILVAFSRRLVLELKQRLEEDGRNVSVVYGALPPEVRRRQAERFAAGETDVCVATDAVGMGLNLPADYVCFFDVEKFDGQQVRLLTPTEIQQIGGRAGRYGMSQAGEVGALSRADLNIVRSLFYQHPKNLTHARVAPTVDDLALIPGSLSERLAEWAQLGSIPDELRHYVRTAEMTERVELAAMLSDEQVEALGLPGALTLVNAPARRSTRPYWYECAMSIIDNTPMPPPPNPPTEIDNHADLDDTEYSIACADIYLWLGHRREFTRFTDYMEVVQLERRRWSDAVDEALLNRLRAANSAGSFRRRR